VTAIRFGLLVLVASGGSAVVLTREPLRQAMVLGVYGLVLALLFFTLGAPDVALSQIVVSTVALPMMILLTLAKVGRHERDSEGQDEEKPR
jgi:energy-converting hydrogenase B subunit D